MAVKYPFSPEVLDALPEELAELFRELELTLLKEICSRLNLAGQLNEVTVQDIRALRAHGIDLKDIKKAIEDVTGLSQKKLDQLFDEVVARNQAYYKEVITLAQVTEPQKLVDEADVDAIRKQCQREFVNITASLGFLVDAGHTMLSPAKAYQWALDKAALEIQSGAIDYNTAIRNAVKELADSGLKTVDYESGRVDQIDVAARRAVMTGVNQVNARYREQSMDYLGTDLVEVSAHLGARNVDGPKGWENHAKWQGKVYRWRGHGEQTPEPPEPPRDSGGTAKSGETIDFPPESATIKEKEKAEDGGGTAVTTIGKIDIEKYRCVTPNITTDEVIITDERIQHIKSTHPNDYERFSKYIVSMVENPQYILADKVENTAVILQEFSEVDENFRLILKLAVEGDDENKKNSIITFMKISEKKYKKYLRNKKILYKSE